MEVESQLLAEQLSHCIDQQKGMELNLVLLMLSVVRCLAMMCSARDGARPFLESHHAIDYGEGGGRGEG
jgi:hypothetical protein